MGKSKSQKYPNGERRVEKATGKKLAPHSLRTKHKYLDECTDDELKVARIKRED